MACRGGHCGWMGSPPRRSASRSPRASRTRSAPAFTLRKGQHTLEYTAEPFPPLRCQISQPASASDTCPLFDPPPKYPVQNQNGSRILDVGATLDRLPASQLSALQQATQTSLDDGLGEAMARVELGERYLGADSQIATTTQA